VARNFLAVDAESTPYSGAPARAAGVLRPPGPAWPGGAANERSRRNASIRERFARPLGSGWPARLRSYFGLQFD